MTGSPFTRRVRRAHHATHRSSTQRGFILLPVVLAIVLVAALAFLLNNQSVINVDVTAGEDEASRADAIAAAGLAHATWGVQHGNCAGDMSLATVPFGAGNYSASVDAAATSTSSYTLNPDRDAFIRENTPDANYGTDNKIDTGAGRRGLIHFDLSSIAAGSRVVSATLWLYVSSNDPVDGVNIHAVTADWTEAGATWNTVGTHFTSQVQTAIAPRPSANVWISVPLTALTQSWVNNAAANHGIMLIGESAVTSTKFLSRDDSNAATHPYLQITTADGAVSPVQISATGTLPGGPGPAGAITRTLTRTALPAYQPPGARVLQPGPQGTDTYIYEWKPGWNYGASTTLWAENRYAYSRANGLLKFNLASVPADARVTSAVLELYQTDNSLNGGPIGVHRVTRAWIEGAGNGANGAPNWTQRDATNAWTSAGGDYDAAASATTTVPAATGWSTWDITTLVDGWVSGEFENNGLALVAETFGSAAHFASSDATDPTLRPKLTLTFACECGNRCLAPQGTGTVMMVVVNPTTLVPADAYKKALFESWGYTVNVISENSNAAAYMSESANNDVYFISESVNSSQVGARIKDVPIGVVSQDGSYNADLGLAGGSAVPVGAAINVTDTSHYITALFPAGPLDIYAGAMEQLTVSGTGAPGLQTLADSGGAGSLVVLDRGANLYGGGTAAGRRVMLPLGRDTKFNWDYLNASGRLILQRALQWGTGNTGEAPAKTVLLVVVDPASLTAQETAKQALMESWGYTVNLIGEGASQGEFDAAVATADVAYVAEDINSGTLGTKLRAASIGVVNEEQKLLDEFGISSSETVFTEASIEVTDNTHYITQPFSPGAVVFATSVQPVGGTSGTLAPGLQVLAQRPSSSTGMLEVIDTGGALYDTGTAAGRRVKLPWGDNDFDINAITADGQTILRRSLEWAAGAGCGITKSLLMLVGDAANPTAEELSRKTLLESWCYSVSTITASVPQATYDTFADNYDVVYVPSSVNYADVTSKLKLQPVGVVNEVSALSAYLGFTSGTNGYTGTVTELTDNTHYITKGLTLGNLAITTTSTSLSTFVNTMGPGLHTLSTRPSYTDPMIMTLDTGDELLWGGNAPERRVMLPWRSSTFSPNNLTADGQTILQRAIEWASGLESPLQPIAHWKLDETSGTTAVDSAGGHNGTLINGPSWTTGQLDGALSFDGSNDYINVSHDDTLSLTSFSISAWIYPTSLSGWQGILVKTTTPSVSNYYFGLNGDEVDFGFYNSGWVDFATTTANLVTNHWYHVAVTFDDASGEGKIYLDGALLASGTTTKSPLPNSDALTIGRTETTGENWHGSLDDIRIYDAVLSPAEVTSLASAGGGGGGVSGYYLDEFPDFSCDGADEYVGSSGTLDWSGSAWVEVGDDGRACGANFRVLDDPTLDDPTGNRLRLQNKKRSIYRQVDLSGYTGATLSLDYRRAAMTGQAAFDVMVSGDGGSNWTVLGTLTAGTDAAYQSVSYDISAYIATNTQIQLQVNTKFSGEAYIDNVRIDLTGGAGG